MATLAPTLQTLLRELNAHAPKRSKKSDGWIGDPAHAARDSDHNPNALGVVRAIDVTDDPAGGLDGSELFHLLADRLGKHPGLKSGAYLIHNGLILSTDRLKEGPRPYTGANAHRQHVHISCSTAPAGYNSTRPFNLWRKPAMGKKPIGYPRTIDVLRIRNEIAALIADKRIGPARRAALRAAWLAMPKR